MKKIYFFGLLASFGLISNSTFAQKHSGKFSSEKMSRIKKAPSQNEVVCDVLSQIGETEDVTIYTFSTATNGYLTGTNSYGDKQKANFFDFSGSDYTTLSSASIYIAKANSSDLTKVVTVRVYDGTTGTPTTELGSKELTLAEIRANVLANNLTDVTFSPAVILPTSKAIFVSIDISNLDWAATPMRDSLAIVSSLFYSDGGASDVNTTWEQWNDDTWHAFDAEDLYADALRLVVFPEVCFDNALPVKLSAFTANRFGTANKLAWTTESETGSKGFEVQRSADGVNFTTIVFVPTKANGGNSTSTLQYSYADNSVLPNNNYYRIKQIDVTSKATFTKTLLLFTDKLKKEGIVQAYPNPVKSNLNVILDLPTGKNNTLTVVDLAGRTLMTKAVKGSNGNQTTTLNVANLAKGTYFVKLTGEGNKKLVKFIKD